MIIYTRAFLSNATIPMHLTKNETNPKTIFSLKTQDA